MRTGEIAPIRRRRIPLLLLLAALAFLAVATVEPLFHAHTTDLTTTTAPGENPRPAPLGHDAGCALCHAGGSPALPTLALLPLPFAAAPAASTFVPTQQLSSAAHPPHRARAPPPV